MPLSPEVQTAFEKMIDDQIERIPVIVREYQAMKLDPSLKLKEESDFVFGYIWGSMVSKTISILQNFHIEGDDVPEANEAVGILIERTPQVMQAVRDVGTKAAT